MKWLLVAILNTTIHVSIFYFWGILRPGFDCYAIQIFLKFLTVAITVGVAPFVSGFISAIFVEIKSLKGVFVLAVGAILATLVRRYVDGVYFQFRFEDILAYVSLMIIDITLGYFGGIQIRHSRFIRKSI